MRNPADSAAASALAAAVDAPQRDPRARLQVDWNGDGQFTHPLSDLSTVAEEITVERQITGDLPEECTLVEGYTTATLDATLGGQRGTDPEDVARMLSPYRTGALLAPRDLVDADLTCDLGLLTESGRELLRQFTGSTRSLTLSASGRSVGLSALDPAERLRASVTLPPVAQAEAEHYNTDAWPFQWRINTQWVIDYVLRRNGIYASPPPRTGCLFAMTCHGGMVADVGFGSQFGSGRAPDSSAELFVPGPFGMLAANGTAQISANASANTAAPFSPGDTTRAYLFEFWCKAGASNTFGPSMDGTVLSIDTAVAHISGCTYDVGLTTAGRLALKVYADRTLVTTITGPAMTGAAAWHRTGLWVRYNASAKTIETAWMLDGAVTAKATTSANITSLVAGTSSVVVSTPVPVSCLQISATTPSPPADWGALHIPQAEIDTGLNWMTGLPDLVGVDSFDVLKQAAGAEFGVISFTEDGRFRFLNRNTVRALAAGPASIDVTAARKLTELTMSTSLDSVRNQITISATPRLRTLHNVNIYEPSTVDELDTRWGTTWRTVTLKARSSFHPTTLSVMTAATYRDDHYKNISACRAIRTDTGAEVTADLTIAASPVDQDHVELNIVNTVGSVGTPVRFALDDTTPALRLVGYPVINGQSQTTHFTDDASIGRYGRRVLTIPDNPFRQTLDSAQVIALSLLSDLAEPTIVLKDIAVVGDPRVQLLDNVTVNDPGGLGGPIPATVIGSRRALNTTDGLTDALTLRVRKG